MEGDTQQNVSVSVIDWLSARYLLRSLTESVIESCYDKILQSFSTKKHIINTLIKASTSEEIQNIVKILKNAQMEEMEKNNNKIISINKEMNTSYFDYLSEESIFNICEFLSKSDLKSFKTTSTFLALIAFQLMNSYKIGVLNMNELIECKEYKYPLIFDINDKITINRIKQFSKHKSLINVYSKRYNILEKNLFILRSPYNKFNSNYNKNLVRSVVIDDIHTFNESKIMKGTTFFILDKNKILTLDNTKKLKLMSQIHKAENMKDYKIILLQYYDAQKQRIQNVQFLWLDTNTSSKRLEEYILNDLLSIYTKIYCHLSSSKTASMTWCNELLYTVNKMKQFGSHAEHSLIKMYVDEGKKHQIYVSQRNRWSYRRDSIPEYDGYKQYENGFGTESPDFQVFAFQINYDHPYFINYEHPSTRIYPFCGDLLDFVKDQKAKYSITIENIHNDEILKRQIEYFDVNGKCDVSKIAKKVQLSVTPTTTFELMRNQIRSSINCVIPSKYIQIYKENNLWNNNNSIYNSYDKIGVASGEIGQHSANQCLLKWEIVPYDTLLHSDYSIRHIVIYQQTKSIFEFPSKSIKELNFGIDCSEFHDVRLRFKVNDFINNFIEIISHSMYGDEYKSIIDKYRDKEKYSFIIMDKKDINKTDYVCFDDDDEYIQYKSDKNDIYDGKFGWVDTAFNNINICIVENIDYKEEDISNISIIVRFSTLAQYQWDHEFNTGINSGIGFPVKVWITKTINIEAILKRYFGDDYDKQFKFKSCCSKYGEITVDESIYDMISANKDEMTSKSNQMLITLEPIYN